MIRDVTRRPPDVAAPSALTPEDHAIVDRVEEYLARGLDLKRWWDRKRVTGNFEDRFELAFTYNRPDVSYGFFDRASVQGKEVPVLGNFQTMFYDQPKSPVANRQEAARYLDAQIRQFVLHYFMRVSDFRDPQPYTGGEPSPPPFLRPLSWCTGRDVQRIGFGFSQLYYKRAGTGEIGKFPESRRYAIIDLREIGPRYEWIVLKVKIFDFNFVFRPFGGAAPSITVPLDEDSYLIVNRDFVLDQGPRGGDMGRYGFGYAFIKNLTDGVLGWGPGRFDAAMQTIHFHVLNDGRIRVDMVFVANRPTSIVNVSLNPFQWGRDMLDAVPGGATHALMAPLRTASERLPAIDGFRIDPVFGFIFLANLMTGGLAARELCISREQLEKRLILQHFMKHYQAVTGSIQTWRQIRNWLDERSLPRWVITGEST
jgi:hypothetical protein